MGKAMVHANLVGLAKEIRRLAEEDDGELAPPGEPGKSLRAFLLQKVLMHHQQVAGIVLEDEARPRKAIGVERVPLLQRLALEQRLEFAFASLVRGDENPMACGEHDGRTLTMFAGENDVTHDTPERSSQSRDFADPPRFFPCAPPLRTANPALLGAG